MIIDNTNRVPLKNATTNITHSVNLSFEIGTSHIYSTDANEAVTEDMKDGLEARVYNDTNEDVKDGVEAHARNDDRNGKLKDIRHGQNHEMRSGYSSNRMSNLGNPNGILPGNECISGI